MITPRWQDDVKNERFIFPCESDTGTASLYEMIRKYRKLIATPKMKILF